MEQRINTLAAALAILAGGGMAGTASAAGFGGNPPGPWGGPGAGPDRRGPWYR